MKNKSSYRNTPLWRKTVIVATLPLIILIWTIGWVLVQIGTQSEPTEIKQRVSRIPPKFATYKEENKKSFHEQEIPA